MADLRLKIAGALCVPKGFVNRVRVDVGQNISVPARHIKAFHVFFFRRALVCIFPSPLDVLFAWIFKNFDNLGGLAVSRQKVAAAFDVRFNQLRPVTDDYAHVLRGLFFKYAGDFSVHNLVEKKY